MLRRQDSGFGSIICGVVSSRTWSGPWTTIPSLTGGWGGGGGAGNGSIFPAIFSILFIIFHISGVDLEIFYKTEQ